MKTITNLLFSLLLISTASGQEARTVKVMVTEEDGTPIEGVSTTVTYLGYRGEDTVRKKALTNAQGVSEIRGATSGRMEVSLHKGGYYVTESGRLSRKKDHDMTFVLRKIKNPIPLYAKRSRIIAPVLGEGLAYDFELADWVAPHGKGKSEDVFFTVHYDQRDGKDYDYQLEITFPNGFDGIQEFYDVSLSQLKSKHEAPEKGYKSSWTQKTQRRPDTGRKGNRNPNRNYWFRIRSKINAKGELISAHYAKMYGDFPELDYYFNPTPNDRNLEFDPKKNLFKNLDSTERVNDP